MTNKDKTEMWRPKRSGNLKRQNDIDKTHLEPARDKIDTVDFGPW